MDAWFSMAGPQIAWAHWRQSSCEKIRIENLCKNRHHFSQPILPMSSTYEPLEISGSLARND